MSQGIPAQNEHRLRALLLRESVQISTERKFKLASGAESNIYIDAKRTTCSPEAMPLVGRAFLKRLKEVGWAPDAVGGKTVGADPIAFAIARESVDTTSPIRAFIVRKEAKTHGLKQFIEGIAPEQTAGLRVVIVDDVCTQGSSTGEAIEKARKAGMTVLGAMCLVDREEGAPAFLAERYGCQLVSIFRLSELLAPQDSAVQSEPILAG